MALHCGESERRDASAFDPPSLALRHAQEQLDQLGALTSPPPAIAPASMMTSF